MNRRNTLIVVFIVLLLGLFVTLFFLDDILKEVYDDGGNAHDAEKDLYRLTVDGVDYQPKKDTENFLILGLDDYLEDINQDSYNSSTQADYFLLVSLNHKDKTYSLLTINRDTMTDVYSLGITGERLYKSKMQICLAHTFGQPFSKESSENCRRAASDLLCGMRIDYYVTVTMDAVEALVDYVGGVAVTMDQDYYNVHDELLYSEGQTVTMDGAAAMRFVRIRGEMKEATNLARMNRQKLFFEAFVAKVQAADVNDSYLSGAYQCIGDYMVTNANILDLYDILDGLDAYTSLGYYTPDGETRIGETTGFNEFHPDTAKLRRLVAELYYDEEK